MDRFNKGLLVACSLLAKLESMIIFFGYLWRQRIPPPGSPSLMISQIVSPLPNPFKKSSLLEQRSELPQKDRKEEPPLSCNYCLQVVL